MKKGLIKITGFKLGIIITIIIAFAYVYDVEFLNLVELKTIDYRFKIRGEEKPNSPITIVGIDDNSEKILGRWPWPRSYIARFIDLMTEYEAKVVGFDIAFTEPDLNSELMLIKDIKSKRKLWNITDPSFESYIRKKEELADNDLRLARAIEKNGRVILGYFFHSHKSQPLLKEGIRDDMSKNYDWIKKSKLSEIRFTSEEAQYADFLTFQAADVNIKPLSDTARGLGFFSTIPDVDGTVRWAPLVSKYQDELFPPLSLQILREFLREEGSDLVDVKVEVNESGVSKIKLKDYTIPTDILGRTMINFRGPEKTFDHYSFVDVLNEELPKSLFKDRMVIVGGTSTGIHDIWPTPFSSVYPGVETHATVIDNILNQNSLISPDWAAVVDILTILLLGIAVSFSIPKHSAVRSSLFTVLALIGYVVLNYLMFSRFFIYVNLTYPIVTLTLIPLNLYTYRFATEERKKRYIKGILSNYVSGSVVNEMLKNPEMLKLGGQKKNLTVLFSDIRGFTSISENLSAADLVSLLNEYLTEMTKSVFRYEGTLDKYMGDAIMAFYGAPQDQSDHALRACKTALDMMRALRKLQMIWEKNNMPKMDIGIGLNTGPMSVGNMGSTVRFDYTVMGDNVNLGSRLEGINKLYGTNIIISESTYEDVKYDVICRQLDVVRVKGKKRPVKIYQLIANQRFADKQSRDRRIDAFMRTKKSRERRRFEDKSLPNRRKGAIFDYAGFCDDFEYALNKYFSRDFEGALRLFKEFAASNPDDKPAKIFIERLHKLLKEPPPEEWDGVFTMTTK